MLGQISLMLRTISDVMGCTLLAVSIKSRASGNAALDVMCAQGVSGRIRQSLSLYLASGMTCFAQTLRQALAERFVIFHGTLSVESTLHRQRASLARGVGMSCKEWLL